MFTKLSFISELQRFINYPIEKGYFIGKDIRMKQALFILLVAFMV